MEYLTNLNQLLAQQVRRIYDGEKYMLKVINSMEENAISKDLKQFLVGQADEKRRQMSRLGQVFKDLDIETRVEPNDAIRCLSKEKKEMLDRCKTDKLYDAAMIIYNRAISNLQATSYQTAVASAVELGETESARLLRRCLREEQGIEKRLSMMEEEFIEDLALISISV